VTFVRKFVSFDKAKTPVTITLLGCDNEFFVGCKVSLFNRASLSENGFFLTVD